MRDIPKGGLPTMGLAEYGLFLWSIKPRYDIGMTWMDDKDVWTHVS